MSVAVVRAQPDTNNRQRSYRHPQEAQLSNDTGKESGRSERRHSPPMVMGRSRALPARPNEVAMVKGMANQHRPPIM